ncbi:spore coat protein [Bacillus sp. Marseille-P3661]|uniref:spore coat protein n=1 Tax=Bacillus sp. Marseille-P3661 TaxID=1936234 RepID=UPI000C829B3A|nr:spore coat protein [Bacillus sp. Marseille-P3661]
MNQLIQNMMGMGGMTDQVIATDFLISVKSGALYTALALTESATPKLREQLREDLNAALDTHETISNYMIKKGYYKPFELREQLQVDIKAAQTALKLSQ